MPLSSDSASVESCSPPFRGRRLATFLTLADAPRDVLVSRHLSSSGARPSPGIRRDANGDAAPASMPEKEGRPLRESGTVSDVCRRSSPAAPGRRGRTARLLPTPDSGAAVRANGRSTRSARPRPRADRGNRPSPLPRRFGVEVTLQFVVPDRGRANSVPSAPSGRPASRSRSSRPCGTRRAASCGGEMAAGEAEAPRAVVMLDRPEHRFLASLRRLDVRVGALRVHVRSVARRVTRLRHKNRREQGAAVTLRPRGVEALPEPHVEVPLVLDCEGTDAVGHGMVGGTSRTPASRSDCRTTRARSSRRASP